MQNIVEINLENAQAQLIDESFQRLVVVDFWADWCAPCKALMPVLEKLATEYDGAFLLAKVNADEQNMIASQFGVRSLPTVILLRDGQPLDGFTGAKSEVDVREFLQKHLPKPWEAALEEARALISANDHQGALPLLRKVYEASSQQADMACLLAQTLIVLKRLPEAAELLDAVKMRDRDGLYEQAVAQLQLAQQAQKTPQLAALEAALAEDPDNAGLAYQLALQSYQESDHRQALSLLLEILQKDKNFSEGEAKKTYMDILATLGKADPLAIEYQRKLFTLLY